MQPTCTLTISHHLNAIVLPVIRAVNMDVGVKVLITARNSANCFAQHNVHKAAAMDPNQENVVIYSVLVDALVQRKKIV